jgi:predicted DNA-binding protein YlxM (UPF0122 family)
MTTFEYKTYMSHLEKETFIQRMADHFSVPNDSIRDILMWHEAQLHEYGTKLQGELLDWKSRFADAVLEGDILRTKNEELQERIIECESDYKDICELSEQVALPLDRKVIHDAVGEENYWRFKNHIGW